jgi:glycosyltransferase involved in cell wall biosynthesis
VKILLLCYEYPSPSVAGSHRVLYSLEFLARKYRHDITLATFKISGLDYPDLSVYCRVESVNMPGWPGMKSPGTILRTLVKLLLSRRILSGYPSFLGYYYSSEMEEKVKALLDNSGADVIAVDHPYMLPYAVNKGVPTLLLEAFALSEIAWTEYKLEKNLLKKIIRRWYCRQTKGYAEVYRVADVSIAVSNNQRDMVKSHRPDLNIEVVPYGIDTDNLKQVESEAASPTLIITGSLSGSRNKSGVLYFYHKIYPLIKAEIPQLKLFIVGRDPDKEILQLAADKSVVVTGYVEDLGPYLSRAWVVVAPLQEGFGVKVRVLQAMAVGKPVVSTSEVLGGIDATPGKDITIADTPAAFAESVIELLHNKQLREEIGTNARRLMETHHSWEKLTDRLNDILEKVAKAGGQPRV